MSSFPYKPLFKGISDDLAARAPIYCTDLQDVFNLKVLASIIFMFFTSLGPAITFASLIQTGTENHVGAVEVLAASSISGMVFALFGGQPLLILGVTGPVSVLTISIFGMSSNWGLKFLPFYAWSQIWAAAMHVFLAVINFTDLISYISRFSGEIFGALTALIYIYTGCEGIGNAFGDREMMTSALFSMLISFGTAWLALKLSAARSWKYFSEPVRVLIADYGATVSLIFWTAVPYMGSQAQSVTLKKMDLPDEFGTSSGRSWLVDLSDIPVWGVFAAILPGFIITVLFFFDHNVSSLMAQAPELKLKKPSAFHWDFVVLGISIFITGILGIPPCNGLIPQAQLHVRSLSIVKSVEDSEGNRREEVVAVYEQRVSNFMQAALLGIMIFNPFLKVLKLIPDATLNGLFLFLGMASFIGNQFFERLELLITDSTLRKSNLDFVDKIPFGEITQFTIVQLILVIVIFLITLTPAAVVFPVLIGVLIPLRSHVFPKFFPEETLELLDSLDETTKGRDSLDKDDMYTTKDNDSDYEGDSSQKSEAGTRKIYVIRESSNFDKV